jgi:hypothetical protein
MSSKNQDLHLADKNPDKTEAAPGHLKRIAKTLTFVAEEINKKEIDWLLGASGALFVWGIKIIPQDLDIFVSADNVVNLGEVFKKYITRPLHYFHEGNKKYLEFQMKINRVEVEICELNFKKGDFVLVDFGGKKIPVNPLEKELEFYQKRPGRKDRVELIKKRLKGLLCRQ